MTSADLGGGRSQAHGFSGQRRRLPGRGEATVLSRGAPRETWGAERARAGGRRQREHARSEARRPVTAKHGVYSCRGGGARERLRFFVTCSLGCSGKRSRDTCRRRGESGCIQPPRLFSETLDCVTVALASRCRPGFPLF